MKKRFIYSFSFFHFTERKKSKAFKYIFLYFASIAQDEILRSEALQHSIHQYFIGALDYFFIFTMLYLQQCYQHFISEMKLFLPQSSSLNQSFYLHLIKWGFPHILIIYSYCKRINSDLNKQKFR